MSRRTRGRLWPWDEKAAVLSSARHDRLITGVDGPWPSIAFGSNSALRALLGMDRHLRNEASPQPSGTSIVHVALAPVVTEPLDDPLFSLGSRSGDAFECRFRIASNFGRDPASESLVDVVPHKAPRTASAYDLLRCLSWRVRLCSRANALDCVAGRQRLRWASLGWPVPLRVISRAIFIALNSLVGRSWDGPPQRQARPRTLAWQDPLSLAILLTRLKLRRAGMQIPGCCPKHSVDPAETTVSEAAL